MARIITLALFILAFSAVGEGQGFVEVSTIKTTSVTATVTWDSTHLGSGTSTKTLEVINDGTPNLHVALGNDTASGNYVVLKQNEKLRIERLSNSKRFIRAKSASSTAAYRITVGK